mgnify:FL=1
MAIKWCIVHASKVHTLTFYKGDSMLLTKKVAKFNNNFLIKIPVETKNFNDLSENRWGYKKLHYIT